MNILYMVIAWYILLTVIGCLIPQKWNRGRLNCPVTLTALAAAMGSIAMIAAKGVVTGLGFVGTLGGLTGTAGATGTGVLGVGYTGAQVFGGAAILGSVAGTAVSGATSIAAGYAQQEAAEYNATLMEYNATIANQQAVQRAELGRQEELRQRRRVSGLIGQQRATFGATGAVVDTGSTLGVIEDTAYLGEQDAMSIRYNSAVDVWALNNKSSNYAAQSNLQRSQGANAVASGYMGAGASLLSGASSLASFYGTTALTANKQTL